MSLDFQHHLSSLFKTHKRDQASPFGQSFWEQFVSKGLPTHKNELFSYVRLRDLYAKEYSLGQHFQISKEQVVPYIYPDCVGSVIVFANGELDLSLSNLDKLDSRVRLMPLPQALSTFALFLERRLKQLTENEKDPFALLNGAFSGQGAFLLIPKNVSVEAPLQILHITSEKEKTPLFSPRLHLFLGEQASLSCTTRHVSLSKRPYWSNGLVDVLLDQGASLDWTSIIEGGAQGWHLEALRATLKRDSCFSSMTVPHGVKAMRQDIHVILDGENSKASLNGGWHARSTEEVHVNVTMEHRAEEARSFQKFKGILDDVARSSFTGLIHVHQEAQRTDSYQLNQNLLLSERAWAYAKPNLQILADDVKASHGATVGQLDPDSLFYLKSRGVDEAAARALLVTGFTSELIESISHNPTATLAKKLLS